MNQSEAIVLKYISSPAGKAALTAAMMRPLRTTLDYKYNESPVELLVETIEQVQDMRQYIYAYVKRQMKHDNLRAAIQKARPEYEVLLDKMLILK
jgi:hypothetical protein